MKSRFPVPLNLQELNLVNLPLYICAGADEPGGPVPGEPGCGPGSRAGSNPPRGALLLSGVLRTMLLPVNQSGNNNNNVILISVLMFPRMTSTFVLFFGGGGGRGMRGENLQIFK